MAVEVTAPISRALRLPFRSPGPIAVRASLDNEVKVSKTVDSKDPTWNQIFRFISEHPRRESVNVELLTGKAGSQVSIGKAAGIRIGDILTEAPPPTGSAFFDTSS
jgi:hypothetical protein